MNLKCLAFLTLVFIVATPVYAANKIKYKTATGEIVCMGAMPGLTAGADETVRSTEAAIPNNLSEYTFNGSELVKKTPEVIDAEKKAKKDKRNGAYDKTKQKLALTDEEMNLMGFFQA
jgi:hypothetical protein